MKKAFFKVTDWKIHKVHLKSNRPNLVIIIEYETFPNCVLCIPVSKDDDKHKKYLRVMSKHANNVHPLTFN